MSLHVIRVLICLFFLASSSGIIVKTKYGNIKGLNIIANNRTVYQFLGVRYAQAPVGQLRFKKPEPVASWHGWTYDATSKGFSCWQKQMFNTPLDVPTEMNEDCLLLNIWTTDLNKKQPVMMWIHGGGFTEGTSYKSVLNASGVANFGVVIVSINYRLGPFGFLFSGSEEAPGNVGFHDQVMAMKWIANNIESFGGDPEKLTIFGESAGATSVAFHLVSPLSKKLFRRAIIQSSAMTYYKSDSSVSPKSKVYLEASKKFARSLGCNSTSWLACLKSLKPKDLLADQADYSGLFLKIVVDGQFYTIHSQTALKTGQFHSNIEILAGTVQDEGTITVMEKFPNEFANPNSVVTKERLYQLIRVLGAFYKIDSDEVYKYYLEKVNETNQIALKRSFSAIIGDLSIACPTYLFAKQFALWSPQNNPVYFYNFKHKAKKLYTDLCKFEWTGVCHAEDVPVVMGHPLINASAYSEEDYHFALLIITLWTNFAKNGNPMVGKPLTEIKLNVTLENVKWPTFTEDHSPVMQLGTKDFGTVLVDPFKNSCDDLWKPFFQDPEFNKDITDSSFSITPTNFICLLSLIATRIIV